jgi:uncharacterized RDD family membrane protein YckC
MASDNPYAPPEADVAVSDPIQLASLGRRLGGAIIDGILAFLVMFPLMFVTGYWESAMTGVQSASDTLLLLALWIVAFLIINGYLLAKSGQTIGKHHVNTRIVSIQDENILPFAKVVGLRYVPIWIITQIPILGQIVGLLDVLFIFRADRRCIHDLIAGTKVVTASVT